MSFVSAEMMIPLESTALEACDYFPLSRRLILLFTSGERYEYSGATEALYRGLLAAESKGRFFQTEIRGRLPFRKLRTP